VSSSFEFRTRRIDTNPVGSWTEWAPITYKNGSTNVFTFARPIGEYQLELQKVREGLVRASALSVFEVSNQSTTSEDTDATASWSEPVDGQYTSVLTVGGTSFETTRNNLRSNTKVSFSYVLFDSTNANVPVPRMFAMENKQGAQYTIRTSVTNLGYVAGNVYYSGSYSGAQYLLSRPGNNAVDVYVPGSVGFTLTFVARGTNTKTTSIYFPPLPA